MGWFSSGKAKILMAEDDMMTRALIGDVLEHQNWQVDRVENGVQALAKIKKTQYDLVLLDHHMPGMEGIEVLKAMRTTEGTKTTPVIILTGNNSTGLMAESYSLNVADFINKPWDMDELVLKVRLILEGKPK